MIFTKWDIFGVEEGLFFLEGLEDVMTKEKREFVVTISNSIGTRSSERNNLFKINFGNPVCYRNISTGDLSKSSFDIKQEGSFFFLILII